MARGNFLTDGQTFRTTSPLVSAYPFTMAVWFYPLSTSNQDMITIGDNATDVHLLRATSGGAVFAGSFTGSGGSSIAGSYSPNTWGHAAGVWTSATSRTAYYNGSAGTTNTTNETVSTLDELSIGGNYGQTILFNGYLADAAIWNVSLTADEIASLAKGFAAHLIRPANLVHYMPLIRSDVGPKGAVAPSGSIGVFYHPPIIGAIAS